MSESIYYNNKSIVAGSVASQGGLQYGTSSAMQGGSAAFAQQIQASTITAQSTLTGGGILTAGALQYGTGSVMQGGSAQFAQQVVTAGNLRSAGATQGILQLAGQSSTITATSGQTTAQLQLASQTGAGNITVQGQGSTATVATGSSTQAIFQGQGTQQAQMVLVGTLGQITVAAGQGTAQLYLTGQGGAATYTAQSTTQAIYQGQATQQALVQLAAQGGQIQMGAGQTVAQFSLAGQGSLIQATAPAANQAQFNVQGQTQATGAGVLTVRSQQTAQSTVITGGVIQNQQTQQVSDMRLKNPVRQLQGLALSNVASLQGFLYEESELVKTFKFGQPQPIMAGLSAQEVQVFAPEIVSSKGFTVEDYEGNEETFLTLDYSRMAPYFVEAIKELKERVEALETLTESLKTV